MDVWMEKQQLLGTNYFTCKGIGVIFTVLFIFIFRVDKEEDLFIRKIIGHLGQQKC